MAEETKKTLTPDELKKAGKLYCDSGDPIVPVMKWNKERTKVVKVGDRNLQEEIQELAKGCTITEQIARLARGDTSMLKGEGYYGDVSGAPETEMEAMNEVTKNNSKLELLAQKYGCSVDELKDVLAKQEESIKKQQEELAKQQADIEKAKVEQEKIAPVQEGDKQ